MIRGLMSIKISSLIGTDRVLCLTPTSSITVRLLYHLNEKYHWSERMDSVKNSKRQNQLTHHFIFGSERSLQLAAFLNFNYRIVQCLLVLAINSKMDQCMC